MPHAKFHGYQCNRMGVQALKSPKLGIFQINFGTPQWVNRSWECL